MGQQDGVTFTFFAGTDPLTLEVAHDDAAPFAAKVHEAFRDRGGIWLKGEVTRGDDPIPYGYLQWVPATTSVTVMFPGGLPPEVAELVDLDAERAQRS